jgi:hypothetical protein
MLNTYSQHFLQVISFNLYKTCSGAVSDQKISKFFVSHVEESMAGHVGINGVY